MNTENIMPCERTKTEKAVNCMIPSVCNVRNRQIYRDRKEISYCLKMEKTGGWEVIAKGHRASFCSAEYVLKISCDDGCTTQNILEVIDLYTSCR